MTPKPVSRSRAALMLAAAMGSTRINHTMLQQPRKARLKPAETQFVHRPPPRANNTDPTSRECVRRRKQMERRQCSE